MTRLKEIETLLTKFHTAWNAKDLNAFASFLKTDVTSISPALKVGIIPIKEKSITGLHPVLKLTKEVWDQFDITMEPLEIIGIKQIEDIIIVELLTHFPGMNISDINEMHLDKNLKITKLHHKKITKYRSIKKRAPLGKLLVISAIQSIKKKLVG